MVVVLLIVEPAVASCSTWWFAGVMVPRLSVGDIARHSAADLLACKRTMHNAQAFLVRDYLD
ncbi:hypothetical protein GCM10009811_06080 [Nostocoides veronense]|uniref:Secreted protein n=1 Tax=Nostocoides veronense TaxID=330836 RepID=A0ABN2LCN8_9MICO